MTRVYLSGPMAGLPDNNFPAFHRHAAKLRARGYEVVNPAEIANLDKSWEECLRTDLREMLTCQAIALMPGWEKSRGANLELHVAHRMGFQVFMLHAEFDLVAHLQRQKAFSLRTFGPGSRMHGICDHIRKELMEICLANGPLSEWVDVILLGLDGAWRSGATPDEIAAAIAAKQEKNERRTWPDWRTMDPTRAIEHDRSAKSA